MNIDWSTVDHLIVGLAAVLVILSGVLIVVSVVRERRKR